MLKLCLIVSSFILIKAYDRGPHRTEIVVERFRYGDYDFVFYSKYANWAEAFTICKATHSRLAVINTPERANFLARALSQTKVGFEDLWIGGRFTKDRWRWVATGKPFSRLTAKFPPWKSYPTKRGRNCLTIDRTNHWEPLFVEMKCIIYRPFICEESVTDALDNTPSGGNEITVNDHQYILYHARVTWEEALAFCKQTESRMATISDLDTALKLAGLMKRTRPAFENAWIGAKKSFLDWVWVATEEILPNETKKNGFPPWRFDRPITDMKGCVLLDHHPCSQPLHIHTARVHFCEEPLFIEEDCSVKKDFICEIIPDVQNVQDKPILVTVDQITYIFFEEPATWVDAMIACEGINMTLATPETERQWDTLIVRMSDMQREIDHIWLGGRWIPNEWIWLNNRTIPLRNDNSTYPPWCTSMELHEENGDCLNLDRDFHDVVIVYGFNCSVKQPFVCQLDAFESIEAPDSSIREEFAHRQSGLTHFEASWECKMNNSHLAVVNNIQLARKLSLTLPRETLVWIDGIRRNSVWYWTRTREVIPDVIGEDNYPPWESSVSTFGQTMCLAMKSGYREQPYFLEKPCKEKLNFLCQFERKELPQPDRLLQLNGIKYYFYKKGVPWNAAMAICSSGNLYLVNVGNLDLANFLLAGMGNPQSQWTSGKQVLPSSWSWITSGSKLRNEIKHEYPPWLNNTVPSSDSQHSCLLLSKIEERSRFVEENCSESHSFVCIDKIFIYNETEIDVGNLTISVQDIITSISKAKKACIDSGKSVVNFAKLDYNKLSKIMNAENVKSLWVDVVHNSNGKWVYADTLQEFQTEIEFPARTNHPINDSRSCLTLQLTTEQTLILIPSLCSDFSRIICMNEKKPVIPKVEKIINKTVTLIATLENTVISDATLVCNDLGGEIVKGSLTETAIDFFKTLHPDYKEFWLGASYKNNKWLWTDNTEVHIGLPLPEPQEMQDTEQHCLIYNRKSDTLQASSCQQKYSTVCEQVTYKCEPKQSTESIHWSPDNCILESLNAGAICRAYCKLPTTVLIGAELHICNKGNWSYSNQPTCQPEKAHGKAIHLLMAKNILHEILTSNFLFVLDTGIAREDFTAILQFTRNIVNLMLLSSKRRVAIELYSYDSKMIDVMENNNCYLIHTVDVIVKTRKLSRSQPSYYRAFLTAEEKFSDPSIMSGIGFLFFFALRPDTGSMNRTLVVERIKNLNVTIIVISVGDEINRSQLEEIASFKYNSLQLYTFKTMKGMQFASNYIKTKSKVRGQDCPKNYIKDKFL